MTSPRGRIPLALAVWVLTALGAGLSPGPATPPGATGRLPAVTGAGPSGADGNAAAVRSGPDAGSLLAAPASGADRLAGATPDPAPGHVVPPWARSARLAERPATGISPEEQRRPRSPPGSRASA